MVRVITSTLVAFLLVSSSLALPTGSRQIAEHPHLHRHAHAGAPSTSSAAFQHIYPVLHPHHHPHQVPTGELNKRELEIIQSLIAREPNFFKHLLKKVGHVVNPKNLLRVAKFGAGMVLREDGFEADNAHALLRRELGDAYGSLEELFQRSAELDSEDLQDLAARISPIKFAIRIMGKGIKRWLHRPTRRDLDMATVGDLAQRDVDELDLRSFSQRDIDLLDDLVARSVFSNSVNRVWRGIRRLGKPKDLAGIVDKLTAGRKTKRDIDGSFVQREDIEDRLEEVLARRGYEGAGLDVDELD